MPIKISEKSKVLLFGRESVEGTAVALTATSGILTKNLAAVIGEGDTQTDEYDGIDTRDNPETTANLRNTFSFDLPLAVGNGVSAAPFCNDIIQCCGFSAVTVAGTSTTYTPTPLATLSSGTIEMRRPKDATNDMIFKTKGARGILGCDFKVGQRPLLTVRNMQGDYIQPVLGAKLVPTNINTQAAAVMGALNSLSVVKFTLDGKPFCATSATSDNLSGLELGRAETFCGSISEASTATPVLKIAFLGTDWASATELNPYLVGRTDDQVRRFVFEMEIGTVAGKKLLLSCAEVQPTKPTDSPISKSYGNTLDLRFLSPISLKFY